MSLLDVLGSPARLRIVRELSRRPMYVSELTENVGMNGRTASHHLSVLEDAGIVDYHYRGNRKYYSLIRRIDLSAAPPPERTFILQTTEPPTDENAGFDTGTNRS